VAQAHPIDDLGVSLDRIVNNLAQRNLSSTNELVEVLLADLRRFDLEVGSSIRFDLGREDIVLV
jgi:hypothetical protein